MKQLSIVIPTYNEKDNIGPLVKRINAVLKTSPIKRNYELVFVDDSSTDGTIELLRRLGRAYPLRVHVRRRKDVKSAFLFGFKKASGRIIGVMDADLSHPPELIPRMIKLLQTNDIVIGSRFAPGGRVRGWPLSRFVISWVARMLAKPLTPVKDPMSGFFFMQRKVIQSSNIKARSCKILLEILCKGNIKNFAEIPYVFVDRKKGRSKLRFHKILDYVKHSFILYSEKRLRRSEN